MGLGRRLAPQEILGETQPRPPPVQAEDSSVPDRDHGVWPSTDRDRAPPGPLRVSQHSPLHPICRDTYNNQGLREGQADFVADRQVFWRLAPSNPRLLTNARGFRGAEFAVRKSPGVTRVITLGCSCTFGIESSYSYPMALEQLLDRNQVGKRYEVINAGVPGYSSFQGVKLLESEIASYQPDVITVYFGWNDHWLARHFQDKDQTPPRRSPNFSSIMHHVFASSRPACG
jgi:hypothetical protein